MAQEFSVLGEDLLKKVKQLLHEGNIRRIIIMDEDGKTFLEIPVTFAVLGVVAAPILSAVGALAAYAAKYKIKIINKEDEEN